jgi:hypothetical protein
MLPTYLAQHQQRHPVVHEGLEDLEVAKHAVVGAVKLLTGKLMYLVSQCDSRVASKGEIMDDPVGEPGEVDQHARQTRRRTRLQLPTQ